MLDLLPARLRTLEIWPPFKLQWLRGYQLDVRTLDLASDRWESQAREDDYDYTGYGETMQSIQAEQAEHGVDVRLGKRFMPESSV